MRLLRLEKEIKTQNYCFIRIATSFFIEFFISTIAFWFIKKRVQLSMRAHWLSHLQHLHG